jgi:hypothetical protein
MKILFRKIKFIKLINRYYGLSLVANSFQTFIKSITNIQILNHIK